MRGARRFDDDGVGWWRDGMTERAVAVGREEGCGQGSINERMRVGQSKREGAWEGNAMVPVLW